MTLSLVLSTCAARQRYIKTIRMEEIEDFVEYLSGQAFSFAAAYHEFTLLFEDEDGAIHSFFEGEDDPSYYMPEIRRRASQRLIRSYICGGKWNVVSVRDEIISSGYDVERCLFFIDRDFDDYLATQPPTNNQTYITDFYSIESHIAGMQTAEVILVDTIGMSPLDPDYTAIITAITRAQLEYKVLMQPFIAWCLASRERQEKTNFNNANFEKIFVVSHDGSVSLKGRAFHAFRKSVAAKDTAVSVADMRRWRSVVLRDSEKLWLRGKYDLWLFESVLIKAVTDLAKRRRASKLRVPRMPPALRDRCLFDLVGGRLQVPVSLSAFLDRQLH